jgi:hypothetical protein
LEASFEKYWDCKDNDSKEEIDSNADFLATLPEKSNPQSIAILREGSLLLNTPFALILSLRTENSHSILASLTHLLIAQRAVNNRNELPKKNAFLFLFVLPSKISLLLLIVEVGVAFRAFLHLSIFGI